MRKRPKLCNTTTVFPAKWCLRPNTEISYSWHVTTQIWVAPLIGCAMWKICFSQSEALPRSGYWISALVSQTSFHGETSSGVANVGFFSQPTAAVSMSKGIECTCSDSAVGLHVEKWSSMRVVLYLAVHHENTQIRLSNCWIAVTWFFFFLKILGEVALELKTDDIGEWIKWHLLLLKWLYAGGNVCWSLEEISVHYRSPRRGGGLGTYIV